MVPSYQTRTFGETYVTEAKGTKLKRRSRFQGLWRRFYELWGYIKRRRGAPRHELRRASIIKQFGSYFLREDGGTILLAR
jgi:hypothetical protein